MKRLQNHKAIPFSEAKKSALNVYDAISEQFESNTGHSFTACLSSNPKSTLQVRQTKQELKNSKRESLRSYKQAVEDNYRNTAASAVLGTRTSKSQFGLIQGFETPDLNQPPTKERSHTPNLENVKLIHLPKKC